MTSASDIAMLTTASAGPGDTQDRAIALDYCRRMVERQYIALPPLGFRVDWDDQPSRHKLYLDAPRLSLPSRDPGALRVPLLAALGYAVGWPEVEGAGPISLADVGEVLAVNGLVSRQTRLNWNDDATFRLQTAPASWSRPTASGGGMYPIETYLLSDGTGRLPRGVFHYDTAHHALDVLSKADRCETMHIATGVRSGSWLVSAARLWKNSFKYNSFCYHVVTQDAGALLASWRAALGAQGRAVEPHLWFDQTLVAQAIDVEFDLEVPMVAVPLDPTTVRDDEGRQVTNAARTHENGRHPFLADRPRIREQSRRTRRFPLVEEVVASTMIGDRPRPDPDIAQLCAVGEVESDAGLEVIPLPTPIGAGLDLGEALQKRHSAFGLMESTRPIPLTALAEVLAATASIGSGPTDLARMGRDPWVRLWLVIRNVEDVSPGCYRYDPGRHQLVRQSDAHLDLLQRHYALQNYSASHAGALLVMSGRLRSLVDCYGAPGYRFLNIEVGQAAQAAYLAATASDLAIGAVLGVDNVVINQWFGLEPETEEETPPSLIGHPEEQPDETSMLFLFLGVERSGAALYDHHIPHDRERDDQHLEGWTR